MGRPRIYTDEERKERDKEHKRTWRNNHKEYFLEWNRKHAEQRKQYYANNASKLQENFKLYYMEHKEDFFLRAKDWRKKNPEKVKIINRKWARKHRESRNRTSAIQREKHYQKILSRNRTYRARKAGAVGSYSDDEWMELLYRFNSRCARCGSSVNVQADHIVPLTRGGSDYIENIQPLCRSCNSEKNNRNSIDYRKRGTIMGLMRSWFGY